MNTDKINNMLRKGNFTLRDMDLKMKGIGGLPSFDFSKMASDNFFLMNKVRSVDLTKQERMLINL